MVDGKEYQLKQHKEMCITTTGPSMVCIQHHHPTVIASYTPKQVLHYKNRKGNV